MSQVSCLPTRSHVSGLLSRAGSHIASGGSSARRGKWWGRCGRGDLRPETGDLAETRDIETLAGRDKRGPSRPVTQERDPPALEIGNIGIGNIPTLATFPNAAPPARPFGRVALLHTSRGSGRARRVSRWQGDCFAIRCRYGGRVRTASLALLHRAQRSFTYSTKCK